MTADLTDCPGPGLIIAMGARDIILDCQGHTVDGDDSGEDWGIHMWGGQGVTIKNCVITGFFTGIHLFDSHGNTISGNTIRGNADRGIEAGLSDGNDIHDNTITNNANAGLWVQGSDNVLNSNFVCSNWTDMSIREPHSYDPQTNSGDDNTCASAGDWNDEGTTGCTFSCPQEPVCYCSSCSECNDKLRDYCPVVKLTGDMVEQSGTCIDNSITFNGEVLDCQGHTIDGDDSGTDDGIHLSGRARNTIKNCVISDFYYGIRFDDAEWEQSSSNAVTGNTLESNSTGMSLSGYADYNIISGNTIRNNTDFGIQVGASSNTFFNNYVANVQNANNSGGNTWNTEKTPGTNILGGPYLGGNYWSDYTGVDTDGDGLGDAEYWVWPDLDFLPLVPFSAPAPVGGIAELTHGSGSSGENCVVLSGAVGALVALTAATWYARRRWLR